MLVSDFVESFVDQAHAALTDFVDDFVAIHESVARLEDCVFSAFSIGFGSRFATTATGVSGFNAFA